jgi:hypothetical protein
MNKPFSVAGFALVTLALSALAGCAASTEDVADTKATPVSASERAPACKQTVCAYHQSLRQESCDRCHTATLAECEQYGIACNVARACAASCDPITCSEASKSTCREPADAEAARAE